MEGTLFSEDFLNESKTFDVDHATNINDIKKQIKLRSSKRAKATRLVNRMVVESSGEPKLKDIEVGISRLNVMKDILRTCDEKLEETILEADAYEEEPLTRFNEINEHYQETIEKTVWELEQIVEAHKASSRTNDLEPPPIASAPKIK
jgi:hypothetical protein